MQVHTRDISVSLIQWQAFDSDTLISRFTNGAHNSRMDVKEIRLQNLEKLISEYGGIARLAEEVDTAAAYISQIKSDKHPANVGDKLARKIEEKLVLPHGWMDAPHSESASMASHSAGEPEAQYLVGSKPLPEELEEFQEELLDAWASRSINKDTLRALGEVLRSLKTQPKSMSGTPEQNTVHDEKMGNLAKRASSPKSQPDQDKESGKDLN